MTFPGTLNRARDHFSQAIQGPQVSLAEAALAIAEEEYPGLEAGRWLAALDGLALQVARRLPGGRATADISTLTHLNAVLFQEQGFRGNERDYYDPRNSFLNEVLGRRLGIPITLSVIYLEVAARLGLRLEGVGFPGHFLVRMDTAMGPVFVDPYHQGLLLSATDCATRFEEQTAGRRRFDPRFLEAIPRGQIVARMLHNLKNIYFDRQDDVRALWVIDRLLILSPDDRDERRDRGLVAARLGAGAAAIQDLAWYLKRCPDAADAEAVAEVLETVRGRGDAFLN